jgi:hypothetical protein
LGTRRASLVENVILFGSLLRRRKLDVTPGRILDALESLALVDLFDRQQMYWALRANLVSSGDQIEAFDRSFEQFWAPVPLLDDDVTETTIPGEEDPDTNEESGEVSIDEFLDQDEQDEDDEESEPDDTPGYSLDEVLRRKDFSQYTDDDVRQLRRLIAKIAPKIATKISRRTRPDAGGAMVDLRRTMRLALKYGGDPVDLARRSRKRKKLELVLLCDVSGSMDIYSRFLIQFIYGLQQEIKAVETFVFSTRLTRVTELFKRKELVQALGQLSDIVPDWSGGTSIGGALREFNGGPGRGLVSGRSVVIIISDGWDRGDASVLEHEMAVLARKAYRVIWLNPLLGSPSYQPLCKGMVAALPHTDFFLPAHNLESLENLARTLETISR